jgi:lipopolysaccharide transport system permease protein
MLLTTCWRQRALMKELVWRAFIGRYKGTVGGILWSLLQPLFLLSVYTFAFGIVLRMRWSATGSAEEYALMLFAGLIPYNAFSDSLSSAPTLITSQPNFVKKIRFPLELLSVVSVLTTVMHSLIALTIWVAGYALLIGTPPIGVLCFPLIYLALIPILLGVSWLLAALGVFLRDTTQLTALLAHTLLFLTPIFYRQDNAPERLRWLLALNPLTYLIEALRAILFRGEPPAAEGFLLYILLSLIFAAAAYRLFMRLRTHFADLL